MTELRLTQCIGADHPALAGHFPGNPLVPGVVMLDAVQSAVRSAWTLGALQALPMVKFLSPLRPGVAFEIVATPPAADGRVSFRVEAAGAVLAQGSLRFAAAL